MTVDTQRILRSVRGRVVAALVRFAGSLDAAEEAFQEAAVAAIETWPEAGVPDTPAAWLTTAGKNHVRDQRRRRAVAETKAPMLMEDEAIEASETVDSVRDDSLRLIFACCHPALPRAGQIALTLKVVLGFTTDEIARAFVAPEPTIAQRIVRAKRTIEDERLPYEIPARRALPERLEAVLAVIYAVFNEGYASSVGPSWMRIDLQAEAIRLARLLADLLPDRAEVYGLLALTTFTAARAATRVDDEGLPRELAAQDRARWDRGLVEEGLFALARARRLGPPGAYLLQAEIAACHVTAPSFEATDFGGILAAYDALLALTGSPVVAMNRAIALAHVAGPEAGLEALAPLEADLARHHLFYATRAELTRRAGRDGRADDERALALATNDAERALLARRLARASA